MNISLVTFETIDSTNTEALNRARTGAGEGVCVIARQQTAGRGRRGRVWVSEKDAGLYFSIILRPTIEPRFLPLITLAAGVAVHDAIGSLGIAADIKWVNDLLVRGKKIAGILAETTETQRGTAVVVGIGINLTHTSFPPDIAEKATSIEAELGSPADRDELTAALTNAIRERYAQLLENDGPQFIRNEWSARSSYAAGKNVRVTMPDGIVTGTSAGIEENGALRVKNAKGTVVIIQAGDVEMLRA